MGPLDSTKILVLSLGTGIPKQAKKYSANAAARWGLLGWVYKRGSTPLIDVFGDAGSDMVDIHVSTLFQSLHTKKNYLRIQVSMREGACLAELINFFKTSYKLFAKFINSSNVFAKTSSFGTYKIKK